ncbi:PREDICTED: putative RING-H2 finger protein ATL21A [Prunus mume]|nr:PREDICTED: putative RING-H2 finger protein ATL21A [Prunus mume]
MAPLAIFTISLCCCCCFFFFFFPHKVASATNCVESTCTPAGERIRFPFWLRNLQPSSCGYQGFDLSCNNQTILTLPSSGDFFVKTISYRDQIVRLSDPDNCLPKRFLDDDVSLQGTPFLFAQDLETYTFLNCSASQATESSAIPCLSSDSYYVIVVSSGWSTSLSTANHASSSSLCSVISTALVPPSLVEGYLSSSLQLAWSVPDCGSCEANGIICELENATSSQTICPHSKSGPSGLSSAAQNGIMLGVGIPALFCVIGLSFYFHNRMRAPDQLRQPVSADVPNRQPPVLAISGLDGPTIESYPTTELGETWELPYPNDNTCPICLAEYQAKETLRAMPECNHYFHASCIDEWLKMNATCPLCRNPPEASKIINPVIET